MKDNSTDETDVTQHSDAAWPDYDRRDTNEWWCDEIARMYREQFEFDGIWIDMNEPDNQERRTNRTSCDVGSELDYPPYLPKIIGWKPEENLVDVTVLDVAISDQTICMSATQGEDSNIQTHYNMHNLYGDSSAKSTFQACENVLDERCFILTRATFAGTQRYGSIWMGDNESMWGAMRASITSMLTRVGVVYLGVW